MSIYGVPVSNLTGQDLVALNATVIGVGGIMTKALAAVTKTLLMTYPAGSAVDMAVPGTAVLCIVMATS